jgi:NTP pyrophosphatase (non-canonical NTP hydrolase)
MKNKYKYLLFDDVIKATPMPPVKKPKTTLGLYSRANSFDIYQEDCRHTDIADDAQSLMKPGWMYYVLGIGSEAGEILGKIKKLFRDRSGVIDDVFKAMIIKECGDVLWYMARLLDKFDIPFSVVAGTNIEKCMDRMKRDVLHGDGDDR